VISNEKFKELKESLESYSDIENKIRQVNRRKQIERKKQMDRVQRGKIIQLPGREKSIENNPEDSYEYYGKTETQINYLRQMEEIRRAKEEAARANKDMPDVQTEDEGND